jgi:nitrogen fixation/metabolism regulation signal transduction histidine kinase
VDLVNPRFQLGVLGATILIVFGVIGVFYATNAYVFWKMAQIGKGIGLQEGHVYYVMLSEQRLATDIVFAFLAVLSVVLVITFGIELSHRVAGPIHRLRNEFAQLSQGKQLTEIKFRDKDFFPELADAFNDYARSRSRSRDV